MALNMQQSKDGEREQLEKAVYIQPMERQHRPAAY